MAKDIQQYTLEEAFKKAIESSKVKFDATVEVHFNLNLDVRKADQAIRVLTSLPHGTGKELKVAVFTTQDVKDADLVLSESDLDKISSGKIKPKVDFDVLVSEPSNMPKLAKIARILGPAGVMPNPKSGTVTDDVQAAVKSIKKGKVEIRTEQQHPMIHTVVGKVSFGEKKLEENFREIWTTLKQNKPAKAKEGWISSCFVTTAMGPSFKLDLTSL